MANIQRIRPGVKAFIVHKGKLLVVKERVQRDGKTVIIHDLPGGGMEMGERVHETLLREVMEEVGLKVRIEKPVGSWDFVIQNKEEGDVLIVCLGYQCSLEDDQDIDITHNPAKEDIFETVWLSKAEVIEFTKNFLSPDLFLCLENVSGL